MSSPAAAPGRFHARKAVPGGQTVVAGRRAAPGRRALDDDAHRFALGRAQGGQHRWVHQQRGRAGCSPARAGTACTWVPPSHRVRRVTSRRPSGVPAGPGAAAGAGGRQHRAWRASLGCRPSGPAAVHRPARRPAGRRQRGAGRAGAVGLGNGRHRRVQHGRRGHVCAARPTRSRGRPWGRAVAGCRLGGAALAVFGHQHPVPGLLAGRGPRRTRPGAAARPGRSRPRSPRGSRSPRSTPRRAASSLAIIQSGHAAPCAVTSWLSQVIAVLQVGKRAPPLRPGRRRQDHVGRRGRGGEVGVDGHDEAGAEHGFQGQLGIREVAGGGRRRGGPGRRCGPGWPPSRMPGCVESRARRAGAGPVVLVPGPAGFQGDPAGQHAGSQAHVEGAVHVGPTQGGQEGHAGQTGQYPGGRRHLVLGLGERRAAQDHDHRWAVGAGHFPGSGDVGAHRLDGLRPAPRPRRR